MIPDPEIIEVEKLVKVEVPSALLLPCFVSDLPHRGDSWQDALAIVKRKDLEQRSCNERFEQIRQWQQGL